MSPEDAPAAESRTAKSRRNQKKRRKKQALRKERLAAKQEKVRQRAAAASAAESASGTVEVSRPLDQPDGTADTGEQISIEPATPPHGQQEDGPVVRTCQCAEEHSSRPSPWASSTGGAACRADLSGAVLMLLQQHQSASSQPEQTGGSQRSKPHLGRLSEFVSGNYKDYYKFRLPTQGGDPRMQAMAKHLFACRRCLDIGCNEGVFTLALVTDFLPKSMLGIDIDEQLIRRACIRLREMRAGLTEQGDPSNGHQRSKVARSRVKSLASTWFQSGNFLTTNLEGRVFDTISCMSVAKWIHIAGGDEDLRAFFRKVHALLCPGGFFVLEPQPWKSYKQASVKLTKAGVSHVALGSLQLRPEGFPTLLTEEMGFVLLRCCHVREPARGFNRPVYWLQKPSSTSTIQAPTA